MQTGLVSYESNQWKVIESQTEMHQYCWRMVTGTGSVEKDRHTYVAFHVTFSACKAEDMSGEGTGDKDRVRSVVNIPTWFP